jgi:hypothetical protein
MSESLGMKHPLDEKIAVISKKPDGEIADSVNSGTVSPLEADEIEGHVKNAYTGSTQEHPFSVSRDAEYWADVYKKANYEGLHRFDPSFQWGSSAEKKLIRKVSLSFCCQPFLHS